jgi:hypothetical protein
MFGLSLGKLLVLVAVIVIVWQGFKLYARKQRVQEGERRPGERTLGERLRKSMREKTGRTDPSVEDTEKCPVCGAYVPVGGSDCGRKDCPY